MISKSFSRSLEQFFLTIGQNNFGNKIPFIYSATTATEDWTLNQMFKPETKTNKINAHKKYGLKCKFSPDSKFLVTTSADHTAKLWDTSNQEYISVRFLVLN